MEIVIEIFVSVLDSSFAPLLFPPFRFVSKADDDIRDKPVKSDI